MYCVIVWRSGDIQNVHVSLFDIGEDAAAESPEVSYPDIGLTPEVNIAR